MHIHLHHYPEVVARHLHHLTDDHLHQAHPVLKAPAEAVVPVVGIGREELADQVAVARVDLHTVETGLPGQGDGVTEVLHQGGNLVFAQFAHEGRRI